jgi:uncharacterized protein involved in outer membrane biogenesis
VLMAVLVGAAVLLLAFVVLQTPWARHHLRELAERQAEAAIDADVSIGALEGNLVTGAELRNVRVRHEARPVASVPEIHVDYSIPDLLTGDVDVSSVRLQEPVIHLRRTEKGRLNIAALAGGAGDDARVRRTATGDGRVPPTTQSTGGFGPLPPVEGLAGEPMDAPAGSRR